MYINSIEYLKMKKNHKKNKFFLQVSIKQEICL
jgi:hypothetical protein